MNIKDWKLSELIEFLNSYNRVFEVHPNDTLSFRTLYVEVFNELFDRSELLAMLY